MARKNNERKPEPAKAEVEKEVTEKVAEVQAEKKPEVKEVSDTDGRVKDLHSDRLVFETADAHNEWLKKQAE